MNQVEQNKSILLKYYSEIQTAQGTRLVGFSVAILTLLQAVQHTNQDLLSQVFPSLVNVSEEVAIGLSWIKLVFFFLAVWGLAIFIVRSIFRFAVFSALSSIVIGIGKPEDSMLAINDSAVDHVAKETKVFRFPARWFMVRGSKELDESRKGWITSTIIAFALSCILVWLLW